MMLVGLSTLLLLLAEVAGICLATNGKQEVYSMLPWLTGCYCGLMKLLYQHS